jgi:hypothetical protein
MFSRADTLLILRIALTTAYGERYERIRLAIALLTAAGESA